MPYTSDNAPNFVKKLPASEKKAWIGTWNGVYSSCIDGGGSKKTCETKAFKVANSKLKKREEEIMDQNKKETIGLVRRLWTDLINAVLPPETLPLERENRAMNMDRLRTQVFTAVREYDNTQANGDYYYYSYPIDVYLADNKDLFAIVSRQGEIYQVPVDIVDDDVQLGTWVRVVENFTPVTSPENQTRSNSFTLHRQADGKVRYFSRACTAVVNRVGEIDSTTLFDSFIEHAEKEKEYPILQFFHQGENYRMGQSDWLSRDGVVYLQSGLFDDTSLARAAIKALEEDKDGYWGISIGYEPLDAPELIKITKDVSIPVYKRGKNLELSLLPETAAAAYFTGLSINMEVERMNAQVREALAKLYGDDKEGLEKFISENDDVNRSVEKDKLIHREAKGEEKKEEPPKNMDVEIEEETLKAITEVVRSSFEGKFKELNDTLARLSGEMEKINGTFKTIDDRLKVVEVDEEEKQRAYQADMPSKQTIRVTSRPREESKEVERTPSTGERVDTVLARMPTVGYPKAKK